MTPLQFEAAHEADWRELEAALDALAAGRRKARGQRPQEAAPAACEPARLALLYRRCCEQLALARSRNYPVHLTTRLDALAERAHQLIYRRSDYGLARFAQLFLLDFPQQVRAHWRYVLVATLVFALPMVVLGIATWADPGFILTMHDAQTVRQYDEMYGADAEKLGRERGAGTDWQMFGFYIRNNISVAFQCFACGIFFGIGSLFALAFNGISAGSIAGYLTARGHGENFYSFVITHGAFELTAIVLAGAAGLRLGHALLAPGRLTRRAALEAAARDTAVLIYGVIALLTIAAALEAFWSSARWVVPAVKYGVGGACWALVLAYLIGQGRARRLVPVREAAP